jgi:hypothetical protein
MAFDTVEAQILLTAKNLTGPAVVGLQRDMQNVAKQAQASASQVNTANANTARHAQAQALLQANAYKSTGTAAKTAANVVTAAAQQQVTANKTVAASAQTTATVVKTAAAQQTAAVVQAQTTQQAALAKTSVAYDRATARAMAYMKTLSRGELYKLSQQAEAIERRWGGAMRRIGFSDAEISTRAARLALLGHRFNALGDSAQRMARRAAQVTRGMANIGHSVGLVIPQVGMLAMGMEGLATAMGSAAGGATLLITGLLAIPAAALAAGVAINEMYHRQEVNRARSKAQLAQYGFDAETTYKQLKKEAALLQQQYDSTFTTKTIENFQRATIQLGARTPAQINRATKAMMDFQLVSGHSAEEVENMTASINSAGGAAAFLDKNMIRLTNAERLRLEAMEKAGMYWNIADYALRRDTDRT